MAIFSVTIFGIHIAPSYYGLMYALGFIAGYSIIQSRKVLSEATLESLTLHVFLGVILGGRLGYVLFYNLPYYLGHPVDILKTWQGGMSFHGGVIGVIVAMGIFVAKHRKSLEKTLFTPFEKEETEGLSKLRDETRIASSETTLNKNGRFQNKFGMTKFFLSVADQVTSILPIGLGLGRIGNYLNGELLGFAPYSGPFAVIKDGIWHFPSTLLEASLEGFVLFGILTYLIRQKKFDGQVATSFLIWYGVFRFAVEFVRSPDVNIGYIFGWWLTMGHILSIPMIVVGIFLYWYLRKKQYTENIS